MSFGHCRDKTCLGFATRQGSIKPAQLQRLVRLLKFCMKQADLDFVPESK